MQAPTTVLYAYEPKTHTIVVEPGNGKMLKDIGAIWLDIIKEWL